MAKSGQSSSLFGLRKSGKTSTIYAIQRKSKAFFCNVVVIDCQNPTVHARRYDALLTYVVAEIRKSFGVTKSLPALSGSLSDVSDAFFQQMNNAMGAGKNSVILIFDEIENISPNTAASPHWRAENDAVFFWQILRSYVQSASKGRLSICIVGTSPHILEMSKINDVANPMYLFSQKQFIPSLTFDETREMVERLGYFMGLEFSPEIVADLQGEYGGHPFFTRQVCSKIHQLASPNRPLVVSKAALGRAKAEFHGQLESYLKDIIEELRESYPEEYELLNAVVANDHDEISEYAREAPDLIDHLTGYGLVSCANGECDIRFEAIKVVLQRLISSKGGGEDRWAEISRRRNALETDIRVALFHWSRMVSAADWLAIISRNLTNARIEHLSTTEPGVLFSKASSPLFFSDLLMILKDDAVLSYLGDRRGAVVSSLNTVNQLRKDAHAIAVSDREMAEICSAFDFLEDIFLLP